MKNLEALEKMDQHYKLLTTEQSFCHILPPLEMFKQNQKSIYKGFHKGDSFSG